MFKHWTKLKDKVKKSLEELNRNLQQPTYPQRVPIPAHVPVPSQTPRKFRRFYLTLRPLQQQRNLTLSINRNAFNQSPFRIVFYNLSKRFGKLPPSSLNNFYSPVIGLKSLPRLKFISKVSIIELVKNLKYYDSSKFFNSISNHYESLGCNIEIPHRMDSHASNLQDLSNLLTSKISNLTNTLNQVNNFLKIGNLPISYTNDKLLIHFDNLMKNEVSNLLVDYNINYHTIKEVNVNLDDLNHELNEGNKGVNEATDFTKVTNEGSNQKVRVKFGLNDYSMNSQDLSI